MNQNAKRSQSALGLYVHIPFCLSRCGYCTFVSESYRSDLAEDYLEAVKEELDSYGIFTPDFPPETIFIGGGTPSCLSTKQLEQLLRTLPLPIAGEVTCEINPDSCSREKLSLLLEHGVNRLSYGIQTFDPNGLRLLQRRHSAVTACEMVASALELGFESVNVDLIHGWPGQTVEILENDINNAVNLGVHHISNYSLVIDSNAAEYDRYRALLGGDMIDDELGERYWEKIEETLGNNRFKHYETSNFSLPDHQCRHNVSIWRGKEYIGIGLGACSHYRGDRYGNITSMAEYIQNSAQKELRTAYSERLGKEEKARECAVMWLRLFDGIKTSEFHQRTGYDFYSLFKDVLPSLIQEGIVAATGGHVFVTRKYQPVLDSVLEYFI